MRSRTVAAIALLAAGTLVTAACSSSSTSGSGGISAPDLPMLQTLGAGEGEVDILAWPGYVEDGSNDPSVDWVSDFESQTGCKVNVKTFGTSDEAVNLIRQGGYDVVSASGDASLRLIAAGDVEPVNTDLVPNYADVYPFLKDRQWNSLNGQMYGIPHGYGANVLMWRTDKGAAPTSWSALFDTSSPFAGGISPYDSPIYIADAALYLMKHNADLGITNPYALDQDQLNAAVDLLKQQKPMVSEYWSDYLKQDQAFTSGDSTAGTTWQFIVNLLQSEGVAVDAVLPEEGATGWSDTWMVATDAQHKNCAYMWMDHIIDPQVNDAVAEWFGEAPSNAKACDVASDGFCESYHAGDAAYADQIWYWTTPVAQCLDGRTDATCTDYSQWTQAWTEVKG